MKIAYIANSRFPSEKAQSDHVMAMCSAFATLGHDVRLYVPDRFGAVAEDAFAYYHKQKTFEIVRVPCVDSLRFVWLGSIALWFQTLTFVRHLSRALDSFAPDIVYSRELYVFMRRHGKGRRIWESHGIHRSWWARLIMKKLDGVITLTNASRDLHVASGVDPERIHVESDAVDPSLFEGFPSREEARRKLGIASDVYLCLYTGKFTTMNMPKGIDEAVCAIKDVRKKFLYLQFLAVGATSGELVRYENFQTDGIRFLGHQPQRELKNFYAAADLLLMPFPNVDHYARFMSPLKLFEYLMSGVPMIVTDLPSVREIVNEREAFFAKPGDASSLAKQIIFAMEHPEDAESRAARARALSTHYTWDARAKRILQFLEKKPILP